MWKRHEIVGETLCDSCGTHVRYHYSSLLLRLKIRIRLQIAMAALLRTSEMRYYVLRDSSHFSHTAHDG
ncbi:unnamed protein product [Periconia digitata]|uniref:Uncharacterized protein n=1 Tax=Periconia digitata TaxID=1303443 RepID=A0A9W4UP57_9PLEO|nr:unnamed protein product [Periconia digitata]